MKAFEKLFGRSPFGMIHEHAKKVHECVGLIKPLAEALVKGDFETIDKLHHEMSRIEHEADMIKNKINNR